MFEHLYANVAQSQPVLIAGPTASGKSALALEIAERLGGTIVNADASQVFGCWEVITARPPKEETDRAPHALYGHVHHDTVYSVGHWLADVEQVLETGTRPIIVGGTGLYFAALTEGLADIPATPVDVRAHADTLSLAEMLGALDEPTLARIDTANRARVQRAWEVLTSTGKGLANWQDEPTDAMLPLAQCAAFLIDAPKDWLNPRIEKRLDIMLRTGAIEEVAKMVPLYNVALPAFRAIGVPEIYSYLQGDLDLDQAKERIIISTRQYAKRQRTWFRKRSAGWQTVSMS